MLRAERLACRRPAPEHDAVGGSLLPSAALMSSRCGRGLPRECSGPERSGPERSGPERSGPKRSGTVARSLAWAVGLRPCPGLRQGAVPPREPSPGSLEGPAPPSLVPPQGRGRPGPPGSSRLSALVPQSGPSRARGLRPGTGSGHRGLTARVRMSLTARLRSVREAPRRPLQAGREASPQALRWPQRRRPHLRERSDRPSAGPDCSTSPLSSAALQALLRAPAAFNGVAPHRSGDQPPRRGPCGPGLDRLAPDRNAPRGTLARRRSRL